MNINMESERSRTCQMRRNTNDMPLTHTHTRQTPYTLYGGGILVVALVVTSLRVFALLDHGHHRHCECGTLCTSMGHNNFLVPPPLRATYVHFSCMMMGNLSLNYSHHSEEKSGSAHAGCMWCAPALCVYVAAFLSACIIIGAHIIFVFMCVSCLA